MNYSVINELVCDYCKENKTHMDDVDVCVFPQTWGSTALGFGGVGGQAITVAQTIVLWSIHCEVAWVAFDGGVAYKISNPNEAFFDDLREHDMNEVSKSGLYKRND